MNKGKSLSQVQKVEDEIIERFCSVSRRLVRKMSWVGDITGFDQLEGEIQNEIAFYETRGFYLFQEPWLEHEPINNRFRVVLTFRPTESNR